MVDFLLLGPVELRVADRSVDLGPAKQRTVLTVLLVDAGRWVAVETLIDRVWGEDPPAQVRASIYAHIARIRRMLAGTAARLDGSTDGSAAGPQLLRGPGGYLLDMPPDQVDLHRFRRLVEQARNPGQPDASRAALLHEALGLWRGEPLAGLSGAWAARTRDNWRQQRIDAVAAWADAELRVNNHAGVIGPLTALVNEHPLVEPLTVALMRALQAAGRGPEALTCYTALQKRLTEELGTDPGAEARQMHQAVLRGEPARPTAPSTPEPADARLGRSVPAQLPLATRGFVGREKELAQLDGILAAAAAAGRPTAVVVSAVSGTAGVGKTALAVHWAHRVANRFPGGRLYVNLRGFDVSGAAVTPDQAVRGFLDALGVPAQRVPAEPQARVGLYRSLLAGRRVLVVLDNARDAEQVRPLLPGTAGCLAVVTSRNRLAGLVAAEGAHPIPLDLLSPAEARDLLAHRLGAHRVAAEPQAVEEIITRCARLPLALAIAAARAATRPTPSLASLASELRAADGGLEVFTGDGDDPMTDARTVFSWSYQALGPGAARLFALLGLHSGPDFSAPAAASLTGLTLHQVRPLLAELARAHLVTEHTPGRYTLHDLLRAYATEQAHILDPDTEQRPAINRILDHYLHTAHAADHLLNPHNAPITLAPPRPGVAPEQIVDHAPAMAWFTDEHTVLLAAVQQAADAGLDTHTWQLASALTTYLQRRGHWHHSLTTLRTALDATQRRPEGPGHAHIQRRLGSTYLLLGRHGDAQPHLQRAVELFGDLGDRTAQAHAHLDLGAVLIRQDHYHQALHHAQQALDLYRSTAHTAGEVRALNAIGWCHAQLSDYQRALTHCQQALHLLKDIGDLSGEAATWDSLGYAHHHLGQHHQAVDCYHQALKLYRDLGDSYNEADTLVSLADTHYATGQTATARDTWQRALTIFDDLDHPDAEQIRTKLNAVT
ncbi:DNA-binding SARP family transcriptional activator/tetratricopeptide (TPR) repeat protein [Streptomyces umbrinus]|uniref:DNA-binding SARP family transcriptional activator/tetratricopeptide (TPR) repeat protein n=1 Tax=Streptomyces umbrinus TaxID=67370 RepID=A0ABU0SM52_9ACTN|nr:BTAD domain-containing putative transcriptional regulator [Streptomyces umbrinus]MDQ1024633.1 DNA-binding SARP family transcriptional activator/tetratricopeptide (TPR) repeat protein [Streptomyces umbrinus]